MKSTRFPAYKTLIKGLEAERLERELFSPVLLQDAASETSSSTPYHMPEQSPNTGTAGLTDPEIAVRLRDLDMGDPLIGKLIRTVKCSWHGMARHGFAM